MTVITQVIALYRSMNLAENHRKKHPPWYLISFIVNTVPCVTSEFLIAIELWEFCTRKFRQCPSPSNVECKHKDTCTVQSFKNQLNWNFLETDLKRYHNDPNQFWKMICTVLNCCRYIFTSSNKSAISLKKGPWLKFECPFLHCEWVGSGHQWLGCLLDRF